MSAGGGGPGPAPANPTRPKRPPGAPAPGHPLGPLANPWGRRVLLGGALLTAVYFVLPNRSPQPPGVSADSFKTPGVKNIEKAYQSGGATATHTKAYGGTVQGERGAETPREGGATGAPGGYNQEGVGFDQRPGPMSGAGAKWNEIQYGSAKGR
ncbi:hypothetical protein EDD37DRAFT_478258 [Exophiala viscosa]|uniref:Uncharacterized protein n=1 Tax=Exophiala viscosa TaxID=2486360 RepID=A0AAN6DYU4_9EURO|nr:hypothetical protein EDD36DRAFT_210311 [Exophiala viscosa]KAI1622517.1 hypothetical protein EDD37DRAFT_478258 [Exophiala viscosa]